MNGAEVRRQTVDVNAGRSARFYPVERGSNLGPFTSVASRYSCSRTFTSISIRSDWLPSISQIPNTDDKVSPLVRWVKVRRTFQHVLELGC